MPAAASQAGGGQSGSDTPRHRGSHVPVPSALRPALSPSVRGRVSRRDIAQLHSTVTNARFHAPDANSYAAKMKTPARLLLNAQPPSTTGWPGSSCMPPTPTNWFFHGLNYVFVCVGSTKQRLQTGNALGHDSSSSS
jgi:hypothetical protein